MAIIFNPYINFNGNAEEAMKFYEKVLGGTLEITRFSDFPDMPVADEHKNLIMHSVLKADGFQLMGSDANPMGGVKVGENIGVSLSGEDDDRLTAYFNGLSEGGTVTQALEASPWGDKFGMFTDKFGTRWLVNVTKPKA